MREIKNRGLVFEGVESFVPYFTYAVTPHCNYKCSYCCEAAENHGFTGEAMTLEEMLAVGRLMYKHGVNIFRVTGGEPTTWKPLGDLIKGIHEFGPDAHVNLNSNGSLPKLLLPLLEAHGDRMTLRVSVDRVSPAPETPKVFTAELEQTLVAAKQYVPVRVNMVVMRNNLIELPSLVERCDRLGFDIKLLDLYYNRDFFGVNGKTDMYWWQNFVPIIDTLHDTLLELGFDFIQQYDHGGYGIPLPIYYNGNIYITIKDSTRGTSFHPHCQNCIEYRCQEGLYSPMLSYNGVLHVGECRFAEYMSDVRGKSLAEKETAVVDMLNLFAGRNFSSQVSTLLQNYIDAFEKHGADVVKMNGSVARVQHTYKPVHGSIRIPLQAD